MPHNISAGHGEDRLLSAISAVTGGEVVERASRGEQVTITRAGKAIAELRSLARPPLSSATLLARWAHLPDLDPATLRAAIDEA